MKTLGQILRDKREALGLTQLQVANKLGYESMQFVSLMERGLSKVPNETLGAFFQILKINERERMQIYRQLCNKRNEDLREEILKGVEIQKARDEFKK